MKLIDSPAAMPLTDVDIRDGPRLPHRADATTSGPRAYGACLALAAILLLAAVLRLHGLAHESLWFDEALSVIHVRQPFMQMLASARLLENMPPLYFCLLWMWVRIAGSSDFAVRLPSALLGVASVWMMFRLARRMVLGENRNRFALLAAFLLAISRHQIAYSQQARAYALVMFLCLLSCDLFLRLIEFGAAPASSRSRTGTMALYVLCGGAMMWTQPFSGFSLAAQNFFYGLLWVRAQMRGAQPLPRMPLRRWLTLQAMILLLFGPWLPHMQQVVQIGAPWMHEPHWLDVVREYGDSRPLAAVLGLLIAVGVVRGLLRREPWTVLAILLAVLPVCVPIWASTPRHPLFIPRYGMPALIGVYLLAAGGAAWLGTVGTWSAAMLVAAAALPHLAGDFRVGRNWFDRPDVRDVAAIVDNRAAPGDGLVFEELLERKVFSVYSRRNDLQVLADVPRAGSDSLTANHDPPRIWFVASSDRLPADGGWIADSRYHEVQRWTFHQAVVAELKRG